MQDPNNFDGAQQAIQQAIGKGAATGPALETETHAVLGTLTPVWGTATAQAGYNADLTDGVLTDPIQNFNPSDFVAASAPADAAAAQKLAASTP
jgi:hypothetical protein